MGNKQNKKRVDNECKKSDDEFSDEILPKITSKSTLTEKENYATIIEMIEGMRRKSECSSNLPLKMEDNSAFKYDYTRYDIPKDDEGYVYSFSVDQVKEYTAFFVKFGVVVIRDVLELDECQRTEYEIWDMLERRSDGKLKRDDPSTWEDKNWPGLQKLGILGNNIVLSKQFCQNRQNEKIYNAFKNLIGTEKLIVTVGRASAMRPTREVEIKEGEEVLKVDKPEWRTIPEWLHWDMIPWNGWTTTFNFKEVYSNLNKGYDQVKVQGILAAVDCGPNEGGFHCVPGFHNHIRGWANQNINKFDKNFTDSTLQVPDDDPIRKDVQTMPIRKGSLLIWSSCLPHGTFPNNSSKFRMVQYIHMASAEDPSIAPLQTEINILPEDFTLTPLGRKLYGFDNWN